MGVHLDIPLDIPIKNIIKRGPSPFQEFPSTVIHPLGSSKDGSHSHFCHPGTEAIPTSGGKHAHPMMEQTHTGIEPTPTAVVENVLQGIETMPLQVLCTPTRDRTHAHYVMEAFPTC